MSRWALEVRRRRRQALDAIKRNRPRGTATSICNEKPEQNIVTTSKAPYERQHSVDRLSNRYEKGILNSIGTFSPDARLLTQRSQSDIGTSRTSSSTRALLSVATIVDAKNESLRRAANNGNMKTVKKLVACGVNPNHCNKLTGWSKFRIHAFLRHQIWVPNEWFSTLSRRLALFSVCQWTRSIEIFTRDGSRGSGHKNCGWAKCRRSGCVWHWRKERWVRQTVPEMVISTAQQKMSSK